MALPRPVTPVRAPWDPAPPLPSRLPRRLRLARWVVVALLLAAMLAWAGALRSVDAITRTIGHDTTVSIVAAERIGAALADADGQLANLLLLGPEHDAAAVSALRQDLREAGTLVVDASQNITFGDEERDPLVTLSRGIAEYEQLVGFARGLGDRTAATAKGREADALMHFTLLPAAASLDRVNLDHLSETYATHRLTRTGLIVLAALLSLAALAALTALQVGMARVTRRLVNIGAALASLVCLAIFGTCAGRVLDAEAAIFIAKDQAFDSIAALASAKALASDANASESFWLLAHGDAATQTRLAADFSVRAGRILRIENGVSKGYLADEMANITFPGEREAASAAIDRWRLYLATDAKLRALDAGGRTSEAISLDVGSAPGDSNYVFAKFIAALEATTAINQRWFDEAIARSEADVGAALYVALALAWLAATVAAWLGIEARLKDYRF